MARIQTRLRRMRDTLRGTLRGTMDAERGMALMLVLMIMMLLSALMIGFMASIMADQKLSGVDRDETQVYAVAHAGMEKLTSDLAALFEHDYSPSGTAINALATTPPVISGFSYVDPDGTAGYKVLFTADGSGNPIPDDPTVGTTIAAGPYQGFKGIVTHYNIMVTARSNGGSEVRMRRELQTVAVPVFQFGLFSESSLSFHAGADFNFGGRVHTNGDLFLTSGTGKTLTMGDKVTAVGEVVRKYLDSGILATGGWGGTVSMAKGTGVYRNLADTEGSVTGNTGAGKVLNDPTWTNLSVGTYNGYIRNGRTGAKRLDLPLVSYGAQPIDLIRRPPPPVAGVGENDSKPLIYTQRYYSQASLRIMLSDTALDMTALPQVTGPAISLELATLEGPVGKQAPLATAGTLPAGTYKSTAGTPLIGGYIKIDLQKNDGTWIDATQAILNLGIAGRNLSNGTVNTVFTGANGQNATANACLANNPQPNAVIRLERVKDVPSTHALLASQYDCAVTPAGVPSAVSTDYWPLALYDTREGVKRDVADGNYPRNIVLGGVMYYVELDTNNLAKWFLGAAGFADGVGTLAKNDNNGYIVYFSDRRNNRNFANAETGELGNEDIINQGTAAGTANGVLDPGEDVNAYVPVAPAVYTPVLDIYGVQPSYMGALNAVPPGAAVPLDATATVNGVLASANLAAVSTNAQILRGNRPIFFRRALKLTGGSALRTAGITGLTIASENPVYVQGDYNVGIAANFATEAHIAAGIIADAIILLSNSWNDINSFYPYPHSNAAMAATLTSYRLAAVAGKSISFTQPTNWTPETDFGNDGGAHNLMRLLENWGGQTMNYRGSMVSFYISRQATGIYKSGPTTYGAPSTRAFNFDTDFLLPSKLPPGTPMFRDVNTLTFRQLLRPNQ